MFVVDTVPFKDPTPFASLMGKAMLSISPRAEGESEPTWSTFSSAKERCVSNQDSFLAAPPPRLTPSILISFQTHTQHLGFLHLGSLCLLTHQEAQRKKAPVFPFPLRLLLDCALNKIMEIQKEAFPPWGSLVRLFSFSSSYVKIHISCHHCTQGASGTLLFSTQQDLAL